MMARHTRTKTGHVLRFNHIKNCWEVYTFLLGPCKPVWRWFEVTSVTARWYAKRFKALVSVEETIFN